MLWVVQVFQLIQVEQMVQVVRVVRNISPNDMHSEDICFLWSKPSNYQEKLRCHACDVQINGERKWKIAQYSGRPETAKCIILTTNSFSI